MTLSRNLSAVILAAGNGTRMYSNLPKVLHTIAGKAMIQYVIDTIQGIGIKLIHLVHGCSGNMLKKQLTYSSNITINWIFQEEQLGTGHAMQQAAPYLNNYEDVLILYGDVPFISTNTLERLLAIRSEGSISIITSDLDNPDNYGRILRKNGIVEGIVEQIDASKKQRLIKEINSGIMVMNGKDLKRWLYKITNRNIKNEFYLSDIVNIASSEKKLINTIQPTRFSEVIGPNNRLQLSQLERIYQKEQAENLLLSGVTIIDSSRFDLRGELFHGQDVTIDINVIIEGKVILGNNVIIKAGCIIKNSVIGDNVVIGPYTIIENSNLANDSDAGPFSRLRPGTELLEGSHVGSFVEMKKSKLGKGSKASHLSYLGDAEIGEKVNIGAGTITCNYDGVNKLKTVISDNVFVGSSSQLIAPVTIESGATIGAGTIVTSNVGKNELVLSRIRQFSIVNWKRPVKKN